MFDSSLDQHLTATTDTVAAAESTRRITGTVKWFSAIKGYGWVSRDDLEPDVYLHISAIERARRRGHLPDLKLAPGQRISFKVEPGTRGPKAGDLKLIDRIAA